MREARRAVAAVFVLNGVMFGSWAVRIPAVRDRVHLSDGDQGIALACLAIGAVLAMPVAGAMAARVGSRRATRASLAVACATTAIVALPSSFPLLCLTAFLLGAGMGALDVTMNAHGVAVERRYGRPILAGFHAGFSAGGLVGGAVGALAAAAGVDVRVQLALVAALAAAVGLTWSRRFLPGGEDTLPHDAPVLVRPPRRLWALGSLAFACLLIEGAAADWSAVYLRDSLGSTAAVAALGFTVFSVAMTISRLTGDRLVGRFGPLRLVRAGGLIGAAGFAAALIAGVPVAGIAGFACLGIGMASVVPIVFRAAGSAPGISPGVALAAVSSMGYLGFVAGPSLIGGVAGLVGLPAALGLVVLLAAGVAAGAGATCEPQPKPRNPSATSAVLSDLDGVLVDSRAAIERGWRLWAASHDLPEPSDSQLHGRTTAAVVADLAPHLDPEREAAAVERLQAEHGGEVTALPGAAELLREWPRDRLAIVTSGTHDLALARLRAARLPEPDVLVTAESVTRGKPDPEGYLRAARELGVEPAACVVLEDAPAGVAAGVAAGMHVVAIVDGDLDAADVVVPSVAGWLRGRRES
jgi:HAD superfamily hydrolase (TIGR01509 family)